MLFSYAGYTVQTSFSFFVCVLVAGFLLIYFLLRALGGIYRLPKNFSRWSSRRRHRRSEKHLLQGLLSMLEGDWRRAENYFSKGASYSRTPMINYLAAARAAQQGGSVQRRDHYLGLAFDDKQDSSLALGLTQAELQLMQDQTEQAYATLKQLPPETTNNNQVNQLLLEVTSKLQDWEEALALLTRSDLKRHLSSEQIKSRQLQVYAGLIEQKSLDDQAEEIETLWQSLPGRLKTEAPLLTAYVRSQLRQGQAEHCEPLLRKALKDDWDSDLVLLYGMVQGRNVNNQLNYAEKLLPLHTGDAQLLLTLGRLSERAQLWGKADSYLRQSLEAQPTPEACHALAQLLEQQGDYAEASEYYQKGLALATGVEPETAPSAPRLPQPLDEDAVASGARQVV